MGTLDFVLHAIAYSDKEELKGGYVETSRDNFARINGYLCLFIYGRCAPCLSHDE